MKKQGSNHSSFFAMFLDELRNVYNAESQIIEKMPKLIQAAHTPELKEGLKKHLNDAKQQKQRLDKLFRQIGENVQGQLCDGIQGVIKETEHVIQRNDPPFVKDAALICAAQKLEHYEIASFGSLRAFAHHLELSEVEDILEEILKQEEKTDKDLTQLAEGNWLADGINAQALSER